MEYIKPIANKGISKSIRITEKANDLFTLTKTFNVNESDIITNFLEQLHTICKRIKIIDNLLGIEEENKNSEDSIRVYHSVFKGNHVDYNNTQNALLTMNLESTLEIQRSNNNQLGYKYFACIYTGVQKFKTENFGFGYQQIGDRENENNWYSKYDHFKTEEELINFAGDIILNGYIEVNDLNFENRTKLNNWK